MFFEVSADKVMMITFFFLTEKGFCFLLDDLKVSGVDLAFFLVV